MNHKRRVLFHRSWINFDGGTSGGQLKVRDAFEHFKSSDRFAPYVYFNEETIWYDNPGNFWLPYRKEALKIWEILPSDILFFSGHDWKILSPEMAVAPPIPIINIVQPRHTNHDDPRNRSLSYPAIRIAKSSVGKNILSDYGVNGPIYLIPDSIDFSHLPLPITNPDIDLLIVGLKNPELATSLYNKLTNPSLSQNKNIFNIVVQLPPKLPTRADFLALVNSAKIVVFLPLKAKYGAEGFYLPALEAMAMNKMVICPYAVGNSDFCIPERTCIQPEYNENSIYKTIIRALNMEHEQQEKFMKAGKAISVNHDIKLEKERLLTLLHQADEIWNDTSFFKKR
jgi:glycosyltransferase involved in cell wall biosynthesis